MTKKEKREIFGSNFHTALRKSLDSKASSICWNAIDLLQQKDWNQFIDNMKDKEVNRENCLDSIQYGESVRALLIIGLEMLSDEEYEVLNKYTYLLIKERDDKK